MGEADEEAGVGPDGRARGVPDRHPPRVEHEGLRPRVSHPADDDAVAGKAAHADELRRPDPGEAGGRRLVLPAAAAREHGGERAGGDEPSGHSGFGGSVNQLQPGGMRFAGRTGSQAAQVASTPSAAALPWRKTCDACAHTGMRSRLSAKSTSP